ncbi:19118_t:CDS:2 [Dentiscutata erythropus]|uniref:19118_t:CDS:1 n=1 Tax=Dentiscutata erythropus TaxID=1348616 RepID=A0A9N9AWM9_9GLOM|nr:19118_t:CDS:2 [Dentiscutata erythropus]
MRPARKQADESILKVGPSRLSSTDTPGTFYNIWYNKWSGGERTSRFSREKAKTRCSVALDAGETKADKMPSTYFCLYFARGCCPFGHECGFWHRIPTESDPVDSTIDVFGRDKFNEYRDDMGGVGSFNRENRTLYVGYIHINPDMEVIVKKHFGEWGEIEKSVAFVTYMSSLNAEFAKEAMSNQSLDHNEVLNVRWATDDPNPRAKAEYKRKAEALAAQAIQKSLPAEFTLGNTDYTNKRPRMDYNSIPDQYGLEGYQTPLGLEQPVYYDQSVGSGDGQHVETTVAPTESGKNSSSIQHKTSIVSPETLESLKHISQSLHSANLKPTNTNSVQKSALTGLADYDSEEDQESDDE